MKVSRSLVGSPGNEDASCCAISQGDPDFWKNPYKKFEELGFYLTVCREGFPGSYLIEFT